MGSAQPHHLQRRGAEHAVGAAQRFGKVEMAVILADDQRAQLADIAHRGREFLGLPDELRRFIRAVGDDQLRVQPVEMPDR